MKSNAGRESLRRGLVIDLCSFLCQSQGQELNQVLGKKTQPENVVIDRCRFVPVPKPRTSIQPGNGKRKTQPGNVVPEKYSARSASQYTDSQGQRPVPAP